MISVVVPGVPVAWARAGRGGAVTFTPARQRSWKASAQAFMLQARARRPPFDGPLEVVIDAVWPRPAKVPARLGTDRRPRPSRPDADNVGKQVLDAAIGVLYADDALVVDLRVRKWVAAAGELPCVHATFREVTSSEGRSRPS